MITINFRGWFQSRLSTDPDPHDERRGVSGNVHAYVDEPDLDRIVHWQKPTFVRRHAPTLGVFVDGISIDGVGSTSNALLGAAVDLHNQPKFEGRNGVIAEDGFEPLYPFDLSIAGNGVLLRRAVKPLNPEYPYDELLARGEFDPQVAAEISAATGIQDLLPVWRERLNKLQADAASLKTELERVGNDERIAMLRVWLARGPSGPARFFGVRLVYQYVLRSKIAEKNWSTAFPGESLLEEPWTASFWLGGWDTDVLCGFCVGSLSIPTTKDRARVVSSTVRD
jgi:hypothetical protein